MATTYGMGGGTPIMSTTMPPPPSGVGGMATPMTAQNMGSINTGGYTRNMSLPLALNRPINVDENTPNLEEIQGFPVAGRTLDGAHFHQDPVTGQMYRMTDELHDRIPQILADRRRQMGGGTTMTAPTMGGGTTVTTTSDISDGGSYEDTVVMRANLPTIKSSDVVMTLPLTTQSSVTNKINVYTNSNEIFQTTNRSSGNVLNYYDYIVLSNNQTGLNKNLTIPLQKTITDFDTQLVNVDNIVNQTQVIDSQINTFNKVLMRTTILNQNGMLYPKYQPINIFYNTKEIGGVTGQLSVKKYIPINRFNNINDSNSRLISNGQRYYTSINRFV